MTKLNKHDYGGLTRDLLKELVPKENLINMTAKNNTRNGLTILDPDIMGAINGNIENNHLINIKIQLYKYNFFLHIRFRNQVQSGVSPAS